MGKLEAIFFVGTFQIKRKCECCQVTAHVSVESYPQFIHVELVQRARRMLSTFIDVCDDYKKTREHHEEQLLRWLRFGGRGSIESEILDFLRLIAQTLPEEQIQKTTLSGKGLLEAMLSYGLPTHRLATNFDSIGQNIVGPVISSGADLEDAQRFGQSAFLACYSSILCARVESPEPIALRGVHESSCNRRNLH